MSPPVDRQDSDRTSCPLCESKSQATIAEKGRSGEDLHTVLCQGCGLVFTSPVPTEPEVAAYYAKEYRRSYKGVAQPKLKHVYRSGIRALARFSQVTQVLPQTGRVIDIGSGGGEFVYLLAQRGYQASGIEPDEGYGGYAISEYGIDVQIGPFFEATLEPDAFDLVTAHHVVEHLRDPISVFQGVLRALKTGGHFIVEVPNVESTYHAPHNKWHYAHIFNYNPRTLEDMGRKAGFSVVETFLQPGTQHVNTLFRKTHRVEPPILSGDNAHRVQEALAQYTNRDHYLSLMPIKRAWSSLSQTVHESRAVDSTLSGKQILDRLYAIPQRSAA